MKRLEHSLMKHIVYTGVRWKLEAVCNVPDTF
jgi:hypothetical protein